MQLQSTPATQIYINPDIDIAKQIAASLSPVVSQTTNTQQRTIQAIPRPSQRNRTTIADLEAQDINALSKATYTCTATVTTFITGRPWYYTACPLCYKKLHEEEHKYRCVSDGEQPPSYMYCLPAIIEDHTGWIAVTIFSPAATQMVGTTCFNLVVQHGYSDPIEIPPEVTATKGKSQIFQLHQLQKNNKGDVRGSVNRVFEDSIYSETTSATPSTLTTENTPIPQTPAEKEQLFPSTKRQLFQSPDESISETKKVRYPDA